MLKESDITPIYPVLWKRDESTIDGMKRVKCDYLWELTEDGLFKRCCVNGETYESMLLGIYKIVYGEQVIHLEQ